MRSSATRWLGAGALGAIALGAVTLISIIAFRPEQAWVARVVSVSDHGVCLRQLEGGDHPGGPQPCFTEDHGRSEVPFDRLAVGDCVRLRMHHPELVLERRTDCPVP